MYNDNPLLDDRGFEEKLREQLADDQQMTRLTAELLAVYFLFAAPHTVGAERKLGLISAVLDWGGDGAPEVDDVRAATQTGIGGPGQAYNNLRWKHLVLLAFPWFDERLIAPEAPARLG